MVSLQIHITTNSHHKTSRMSLSLSCFVNEVGSLYVISPVASSMDYVGLFSYK